MDVGLTTNFSSHGLYAQDIHKALPASHEAEQGAICSIMLDPAKSLALCEEMITVEMIYNPGHRLILEALIELFAKTGSVDLISLHAVLQEKHHIEAAGGPAYLAQLLGIIPTAANLKFYLEIIRDQYRRRELIRHASQLQEAAYNSAEDIPEAIVEAEKAIAGWKDTATATEEGPSNAGWIDILDVIENRGDLARVGKIEGIPTGGSTFDRITGGLQQGTLYVIGAAPNVGKSLLVGQWVENAAVNYGVKSVVFSLEMRKSKYRERLIVQSGACGSGEMKSGLIKESSFPKITRALGNLKEKVFIDDSPCLTVAMIIGRLKRHFLKHPDTGLVAIDYLQLIQPAPDSRRGGANREQQVNQMVRDVDSIKKLFNVPVLLITSLNRKPEDRKDRRPRLSDSRDSGQIEFQADVGILLHFPESDESTKTGYIIIDKQRDGETRDIAATFNKTYLRFQEER